MCIYAQSKDEFDEDYFEVGPLHFFMFQNSFCDVLTQRRKRRPDICFIKCKTILKRNNNNMHWLSSTIEGIQFCMRKSNVLKSNVPMMIVIRFADCWFMHNECLFYAL